MPHELWHVPGVVGIMSALIGLMGIYLRQAPRVGKLGHVGFVLLIVGVTLGAGYSTIFHAIFLPSLEQLEQGLFQEFIDAPVTVAQAVRGITVQAIGLGLGAILFGAATVRARVLPRSGGWLMIAAALFAASQEAIDGAQLISRLLFAATFLLLGSALLREPRSPQANPRSPYSIHPIARPEEDAMTLNDQQSQMNISSRWDFSDLSAVFLNCTLKRSPAHLIPKASSISPSPSWKPTMSPPK